MLNDVPLNGQTLNTTKPLIRQNFTTFIDNQFKIDHQEFNTGANSGKHKGIHLIDGVPSPAIDSTEIGIYNVVTAGVPSLMIKKGTATPVDITLVTSNTNATGTEYTLIWPSGTIWKWKNFTGSAPIGSGLQVVTFNTAFPTACDNMQVTTITPATFNAGDWIAFLNDNPTSTGANVFWRRYRIGGDTTNPRFMYFATGR